MAIEIACENGHSLTVLDEHAGKKGRCPVCKALVRVPVSDEFVVDLLGELPVSWKQKATTAYGLSKKTCQGCNESVEVFSKVCPYCNTYIGR